MRFRVWAAFQKGGSPLFVDIDEETIEDAWTVAEDLFDKAERILIEPLDKRQKKD